MTKMKKTTTDNVPPEYSIQEVIGQRMFRDGPKDVSLGWCIVRQLPSGRKLFGGRNNWDPHVAHQPYETEQQARDALQIHLELQEQAERQRTFIVHRLSLKIAAATAYDRKQTIRVNPRLSLRQTQALIGVQRAAQQMNARLESGAAVDGPTTALLWILEQIAEEMPTESASEADLAVAEA